MSVCILLATGTIHVALNAFTLSWTHSVEQVQWQEDWLVESQHLVLKTARVKGSGAGMEPGDNAVLKDGWWEWQPTLAPLKELSLAASGATTSGWLFCASPTSTRCYELAIAASEAIIIKPCD